MPSFDCPRCGAALRRGRKFCSSCGLALVACPACDGLNARGARFCGDCGSALPPTAATAAGRGEEAGGDGAAERRQLTVMFCDLVGSTALSDRLDPEDLQLVIAAFHSCAAELVARFDGAVAQYLGDGLLVYFGYPHAHEDDAERSVRAALAIVAAVRQLRPVPDVALQTRIGIATGLVVIGELIGDGPQRRHAVIGKTPNLAARLQAIAEPDSVVIGAATRQLIHALFDCVDLGLHNLKGIAIPVAAWRVVGENRIRSRFEALHEGALTPFIGRERELAVIRRRWEEAKSGRGQVVLLAGEPGMGKSRMVQALLDGLRAEPSYRLSYHGSPYHQNTAFHGIIELLERGAGLRPDDAPARRLAKLERLLERSGCNRLDTVALIAALLAIPTDDRYPPLALEPQQQRGRVANALLDHLAGLAARRPILVNFEDAGLLDPSTLALLGRLIERAQTLPILVIITFRPSFDPPWAGYPHVMPIRLERLDRRRSLALIEQIAGPRRLPAAIVEQIAAQTDGVPLFIEEITRAMLESGSSDAAAAVKLEVPASLQDTLMARLDRLARAKPVAQLGAAIGRAFTHELLAAVSPLGERELSRALDRLVAAGLIDRRGTPLHATYAFKHALVRDAAYASLLHSHRQRLHARIAEALEARFPHAAATQPELLANHCAAAGLVDKAIAYWRKAAAQADARLATAEATAHLGRALALLGSLPAGVDLGRRELDLQLALGAQVMVAKGPSAPETGSIYARASELARRLDDRPSLFAALYGLGVFHFCRAELPQSRAISDEMLRLAAGGTDSTQRLTAHRLLAADLFMLGDFSDSRRELVRALALYEPERHGELRRLYAYDSRIVCAMYLAWTDFMLGHAARALAGCRAALAEARALEHPHTLAFALDAACVLHQLAGEHGTAKKQAAALLVLAERHDYAYWLAQAKMYRGWTLAASGGGGGIAALREGIAAHEATGGAIFVPYHLARLAEAELASGAADAARRTLGDALARVERSSERWVEAELHRLTGLALIASHRPAEAEACFRRGLAVAQRQEARFWALSAGTALARLLAQQDRRAEARDLLAPVVGWFADDAPLAELCAARTLLATLG